LRIQLGELRILPGESRRSPPVVAPASRLITHRRGTKTAT